MKLLVVLSIKDYEKDVAELLLKAGITRFSTIGMTGYKKKKESLGWFAVDNSNIKTNSILMFSFTDKDTANKAVAEISSCNLETKNPFPVHAFVMDVEQFSDLL